LRYPVTPDARYLGTASSSRAFYAPLPLAHSSPNNTKQRMRGGLRSSNLITVPRRRSTPEFATEVLPLVEELPFGLRDTSIRTFRCDDESCVERIASGLRLLGYDTKVTGDACHRVGGGAKTLQLRVTRVAASATEKHRLRKKGLAPQCDEAGGIEMARVESPETHETL